MLLNGIVVDRDPGVQTKRIHSFLRDIKEAALLTTEAATDIAKNINLRENMSVKENKYNN